MAGCEQLRSVSSYVDLRHLASGCGCKEAGSSKRCGEVLEFGMDGWSVEEKWKKCGRSD
jgi:hypothetical protein